MRCFGTRALVLRIKWDTISHATSVAMRPWLRLLALLCLASCGAGAPKPWAMPISEEGPSAQCEAGDGKVCVTLMQLANTKAELQHYGERACKSGEAIACEYLGNLLFVRSRYPRGSENAASLVAESEALYELGCKQDAWYSCVLVAEKAPEDAELKEKAQSLALSACLEDGVHEACEMLSRGLNDAGKTELAKDLSTKGCRAFLSNAEESAWDKLRKETRTCALAKELGASDKSLLPVAQGRGIRRVPSESLASKRVSGEAGIDPPRAVDSQMRDKRLTHILAEFRLCLSAQGRVSDINLNISSGFPRYDRKIFEGMQKWRYSPRVEDGKPVPVCSSVTFIYVPRY